MEVLIMHRFLFVKPSRVLVMSGAVVALIATTLTLAGSNSALGQDAADCEVTDLGTLGSEAGSVLEAEGRWTTEDCESRFRPGSDAHTYRFHVEEPGRIRIGLTSAVADSYLYLLAEDGSRITDNDDNGNRLDARVERDLVPGAYLVEATTVAGRARGPADFTLTVNRVEGCDFVHLGTLEPGVDLTATGTWSLETCGSRFVSRHPAHAYSFDLTEAARVRIDLESESGDPVLSLASLASGIVAADDDSGDRGNSLIREYLPPGLYFIEATTYYARDYQPLQADFTLTVRLVDELSQQQEARLKVEEVRTPSVVVAGDPFPVHFRVSNVGGGTLPDDGSHARIWLSGHAGRDLISRLTGIWDAGVAYHTGDEAASATSNHNRRDNGLRGHIERPRPNVDLRRDRRRRRRRQRARLARHLAQPDGAQRPRLRPRRCRRRRGRLHRVGIRRLRRRGDDDSEIRRRPGGRDRPGRPGQGGLRGGCANATAGWHLRATGDRRAVQDSRAGRGHRCGPIVEDAAGSDSRAVRERRRRSRPAEGCRSRRGDQPPHGRRIGAEHVSNGVVAVRLDGRLLGLAPRAGRRR